MRSPARPLFVTAASVALLAVGASAQRTAFESMRGVSPDAYRWELPEGFPVPLVPADNPMTPAKVELGRRLFHDPRLSGDGTLACSGCHRPELAYTDGRVRALGATGEEHAHSAMALANVAYNATFGWSDPTLESLEAQALVPMLNEHPIEMGVAGREREVLGRFAGEAEYRRLFAKAFAGDEKPISLANAARALASFERTLISGDSPFDHWAYRGDVDALSGQARAGAALFFSRRVACSRCHSGFNLSGTVVYEGAGPVEPEFHNTGLYNVDGAGAYPADDTGVHGATGRSEDMGRFRAPSLRNVALTAPYMHDGSIATLEEVIDHYARGGRSIASGPDAGDGRTSPLKDPRVAGFELSREERGQLVAFLHALTDEGFVERARRLARPVDRGADDDDVPGQEHGSD